MSRRISLALVLFLLFGICAPAIYAGGPPYAFVSAPTGTFADWGQELVHDAMYWLPGAGGGGSYATTFEENWGAYYSQGSSWVAIDLEGTLFSEIGAPTAPEAISGFIWSGANETRSNIPVVASMNSYVPLDGNPWGARSFSIWTPDGTLVRNTVLHIGETYSTTLATLPVALENVPSGAYRWRLETVPEPSSIVTLFGAMIGCVGMRFRKRK